MRLMGFPEPERPRSRYSLLWRGWQLSGARSRFGERGRMCLWMLRSRLLGRRLLLRLGVELWILLMSLRSGEEGAGSG